MRSWVGMIGATLLLAVCAGGGDKLVRWFSWRLDACVAIEQAQDALESCDVSGTVVDVAPSYNHQAAAGHVRTEGGTLPFYVEFCGQGVNRSPVKVTLGAKILLPKPAE